MQAAASIVRMSFRRSPVRSFLSRKEYTQPSLADTKTRLGFCFELKTCEPRSTGWESRLTGCDAFDR